MEARLAQDIMTRQPVTCTPETSLFEVSRLMADHDCGSIPVLENAQSRKAIGIITDRDVACRGVAKAKDAYVSRVAECMTEKAITVRPYTELTECRKLMERNRVRRLLVADDAGNCVGILSQADLAIKGPEEETLALLKRLSLPPGTPSRFDLAA